MLASQTPENLNSASADAKPDPITSNLIEIRIFKENEHHIHWKDKIPDAYLPGYVTGELVRQNIDKRIRQLYFKNPSHIVKVRWNLRGQDHGYWVIRSHEFDVHFKMSQKSQPLL